METNNFHLYIGSKASVALDSQLIVIKSCQTLISFGITDEQPLKNMGFFRLCFSADETNDEYHYTSEELPKLILRPLNDMRQEEIKEFMTVDFNENRSKVANDTAKAVWYIKNGFDVGLIPKSKFILTTDLPKQ